MEVVTRLRYVAALTSTFLVAVTAACDAAPEPTTAESGDASQVAPSASAPLRVPGDPATWMLRPGQLPQQSSTGFTALVTRLGCNGGVTGQVLAPEIQLSTSEVVVTFEVAPKQTGSATCPGNDEVAYEVDLGEQLRGRALVDGQCLPGADARRTAFCSAGPTRFRP
jgi:hypothetical protein